VKHNRLVFEPRYTPVRYRLTKTGLVQIWLTIAILGEAREAIAAPSVGCAAARGNVGIAICSDPKLSRLNREMRGLYRKALFVGDRRSLVAEQSSWVVERNRSCAKNGHRELRRPVPQQKNRCAQERVGASPPDQRKTSHRTTSHIARARVESSSRLLECDRDR
jgi:hypothetical protein